jgi:tetratricopeptide (TPR) repeat protein
VQGIGQQASLELLKKKELNGKKLKDKDDVLVKACNLLQGHPMALNALADTVLCNDRWGGWLSNAGDIMAVLRKSPDPEMNPIFLFEKIIKDLSLNKFTVLTSMPVFFRPETTDAVAALSELNREKAGEYLDDLVKRSLVIVNTEKYPPLYSLHSLVAEVVGKLTKKPKTLHNRAYDYYLSIPWNHEAKDPQEIMHLIEAIKHALFMEDIKSSDAILYGELNLAQKLQTWGRSDIALNIHKMELDVARKVGNSDDQMHASGRLGQCFSGTGNYPKALEYLNQALDIAREIGDKKGEGVWLGSIGQIYKELSEYPKALEFINQALDIAREIGDKKKEGVWLGTIGQIYQSLSDYPKALDFLNKALDIAREIGDKYNEGVRLGDIGQIYQFLSDYPKALEFLNQALDIAVAIGDKYNETVHGTNIGLLLIELNRPCDAVPYFERALEIDKQIGLTQYIEDDQGNLDKAQRLCKKKKQKMKKWGLRG